MILHPLVVQLLPQARSFANCHDECFCYQKWMIWASPDCLPSKNSWSKHKDHKVHSKTGPVQVSQKHYSPSSEKKKFSPRPGILSKSTSRILLVLEATQPRGQVTSTTYAGSEDGNDRWIHNPLVLGMQPLQNGWSLLLSHTIISLIRFDYIITYVY